MKYKTENYRFQEILIWNAFLHTVASFLDKRNKELCNVREQDEPVCLSLK